MCARRLDDGQNISHKWKNVSQRRSADYVSTRMHTHTPTHLPTHTRTSAARVCVSLCARAGEKRVH